MNTIINFGRKQAEPIKVENGVKQGDILVPTLFSLYFAVVFNMAFKDYRKGYYIRYRTSGKLLLRCPQTCFVTCSMMMTLIL